MICIAHIFKYSIFRARALFSPSLFLSLSHTHTYTCIVDKTTDFSGSNKPMVLKHTNTNFGHDTSTVLANR